MAAPPRAPPPQIESDSDSDDDSDDGIPTMGAPSLPPTYQPAAGGSSASDFASDPHNGPHDQMRAEKKNALAEQKRLQMERLKQRTSTRMTTIALNKGFNQQNLSPGAAKGHSALKNATLGVTAFKTANKPGGGAPSDAFAAAAAQGRGAGGLDDYNDDSEDEDEDEVGWAVQQTSRAGAAQPKPSSSSSSGKRAAAAAAAAQMLEEEEDDSDSDSDEEQEAGAGAGGRSVVAEASGPRVLGGAASKGGGGSGGDGGNTPPWRQGEGAGGSPVNSPARPAGTRVNIIQYFADVNTPAGRSKLFEPVPKNILPDTLKLHIRRTKTGTFKSYSKYELFTDEGGRFLMSAQKQNFNKSSNYYVTTNPGSGNKADDVYLGKLRSNFTGTQFVMYNNGVNPGKMGPKQPPGTRPRQEMGAATYERNVMGTNGPRVMCVYLPRVRDDGGGMFSSEPFVPTKDSDKDPACILESHRSGRNENLEELHQRRPRWNPRANAYTLQFEGGRVTVASVKNFMLVNKGLFRQTKFTPHNSRSSTKAAEKGSAQLPPGSLEKVDIRSTKDPASGVTKMQIVYKGKPLDVKWTDRHHEPTHPEPNVSLESIDETVGGVIILGNGCKFENPGEETVVLQFGRNGKSGFNIDVRYPMSIYQAFCVCLSSFDFKLACE